MKVIIAVNGAFELGQLQLRKNLGLHAMVEISKNSWLSLFKKPDNQICELVALINPWLSIGKPTVINVCMAIKLNYPVVLSVHLCVFSWHFQNDVFDLLCLHVGDNGSSFPYLTMFCKSYRYSKHGGSAQP